MTWQMVTVLESHCVDRPFEVTDRAAEALEANGWKRPKVELKEVA